MDEEWGPLFEFVKELTADRVLCSYSTELRNLFAAIRNAFINRQYRWGKEQLMESYLGVKDIINDAIFDSIYMNSLRELRPEETVERMGKFLDLTAVSRLKESNEFANVAEYRICQLLNCFEDFYVGTKDLEERTLLERMYLQKVGEWTAARLSYENLLRVVHTLKSIATGTAENDHFFRVVAILVSTIIRAEGTPESEHKQMTSQAPRSTRVMPQTQPVVKEATVLAKAAHQAMFQLFYEEYQRFPPTRLRCVMLGFLESLQAASKEAKLLTLGFLRNVAYDSNFYLFLSPCSAHSYLNALETPETSLPPQAIVAALTKLLRLETDKEVMLGALEAMIALARSHYGLAKVEVSELLGEVVNLQQRQVKAKEIDVALKVAEFLELILAQKNCLSSPAEKQIFTIDITCPMQVLAGCIIELEQIVEFFKLEIDEAKRSKVWRKVQNSPTRSI